MITPDPITKTFNVFSGSKTGDITTTTTTRTLQPTECLVRITHSGLCGTDTYAKNICQGLGHEGVGVIESLGSSVPKSAFTPGDRVGWGYVHSTCDNCTSCLKGEDAFCHQRKMYQGANLDQGSLAEFGCWEWKYLFKIPDAISSADAAPLQCGGATVFTPLFTQGVLPTDVVGIVGIGGLGHLAVQFAKKMGCRVVVFSGTESKREESIRLGADRFYVMSELKKGARVAPEDKVNHLLVTASRQPDWEMCFKFLEFEASVYPLGISAEDLKIPYTPLLAMGLRVVGSCVASRRVQYVCQFWVESGG